MHLPDSYPIRFEMIFSVVKFVRGMPGVQYAQMFVSGLRTKAGSNARDCGKLDQIKRG